ncbi:uncharacterized protein PpBr36_06799 [Pyricularia pennisetigena]|nr:uncharacterized protein PpBr36_06799 [Pyricularia pennisetigena]TLS23147.1 hypothetical protein PpBr36_06799 [Pyricularia pennisetigena]
MYGSSSMYGYEVRWRGRGMALWRAAAHGVVAYAVSTCSSVPSLFKLGA